jgi:hypothetical protein
MLNSALWDTIKQRKSALKPIKSSIAILPRKTGKRLKKRADGIKSTCSFNLYLVNYYIKLE